MRKLLKQVTGMVEARNPVQLTASVYPSSPAPGIGVARIKHVYNAK